MSTNKQANRLIHEKSPYLLQHAHNPVNWFPWSDEAFQKAKSEDKPIFLSIGYSTCHWCHVMERESFEDDEVAVFLNAHFISIKVDREERPDIDHIYMTACQAMTGSGGWPLTAILFPDKTPFFAGTYYPKHDRGGHPGLLRILEGIVQAWENNRQSLKKSSSSILEVIGQYSTHDPGEISPELLHQAFQSFGYSFDSTYGGFERAPKFPSPQNLLFLLRYYYLYGEKQALDMVEKTLQSMARGGIYDQIGYGFSRYSTDKKWLVPHFEKMLYDNALMAMVYLEAFQITKNEAYAETATDIFTYVLRDMTSPEGGFYSAEDADSEGVEGKFYFWSPEEVKAVLGEDEGERFCHVFDITSCGNFEGNSIPNRIKSALDPMDPPFIKNSISKLFKHRENRVHPYKDDKILTAWNGLMIAALAIGARVLKNDEFKHAAEKAAQFILSTLVREDGRLLSRFRDGEAAYPAYVDDYAFLAWGLIELYEATYEPEILIQANKLNTEMLQLFWDEAQGGLFFYGNDSEALILRPKEAYDGAMPSGNSVAAYNLLRLSRLTARPVLEEKAQELFRAFAGSVERVPRGHAFLLIAAMFAQSKASEVIIIQGSERQNANSLLLTVQKHYLPFTVSVFYSENDWRLKEVVPFMENYRAINNRATAYFCENFTCRTPVNEAGELERLLHQEKAQ